DRLSQGGDVRCSPSGADGYGAEGVAEDVAEDSALPRPSLGAMREHANPLHRLNPGSPWIVGVKIRRASHRHEWSTQPSRPHVADPVGVERVSLFCQRGKNSSARFLKLLGA